jgi:hypothetical protein
MRRVSLLLLAMATVIIASPLDPQFPVLEKRQDPDLLTSRCQLQCMDDIDCHDAATNPNCGQQFLDCVQRCDTFDQPPPYF